MSEIQMARVKYQMTSVDLNLTFNHRSGRKECLVKVPKGSELQQIFNQEDEYTPVKSIWKVPSRETTWIEIRVIECWEEYDDTERSYMGSYLDYNNSACHLFVDANYWKEEEEK